MSSVTISTTGPPHDQPSASSVGVWTRTRAVPGGRLDQHLAIDLQRRHQHLRVNGLELFFQVLFGAQVHWHVLRLQTLEVERNAQPM